MKPLKATILLSLVFIAMPFVVQAASIRVPVSKLAPVQDVKLKGTKDSYQFSVPVPKRWKVRNATFHFSYTNSSALLLQTSRLVFLVHERPLAQIKLNPDVPVGEVVVNIPGDLFKEGYNTCRLDVAQHYTMQECEDPFSPELWTWVNMGKAYFTFDIEPVSVPLRASAISDFLFDSRNIIDTTVNIIIPEVTPYYLKMASLAASGVALRYDYRPVNIVLSNEIRLGIDNILIGRHEDIAKILKDAPPAMDGSMITIRNAKRKMELPVPNEDVIVEDPYNALVILSGNDQTELTLTVNAFASLSYPFPDSPEVKVAKLELPEIERYMFKKGLLPGKTYSLANLGMKSVLFKGISPPSASINLRLPSDLYLSPNKFASFVFHMAYDAAMRSDSVLNIKLNGKFFSGIRLDNPKGAYFKGYKVNIPLSAFKPGTNQLTFEAVLTPLHTDRCTLIQTENLRLTIFDDSKLILPDVPYWIKMPRLDVFFQDAFPFGKWPDLRDTVVTLSEKTFAAGNAAINLIAICAQKIGYPPFDLSFQFNPDAKYDAKDVIMVGRWETIPKNIIDNAPLAGINPTQIKFQHLDRPKSEPSESMNIWTKISKKVAEIPLNMSDRLEAATVKGHMFGALAPGRAAIMQFQNPFVRDRTIVLLTAATSEDLNDGSKSMWEPAVQAACQGDLTFINLQGSEYEAQSLMVGPSYYLGNPGPTPTIQNYINSHPLIFLAGLLFLLILFLWITLKLLKRIRKKRIATANA